MFIVSLTITPQVRPLLQVSRKQALWKVVLLVKNLQAQVKAALRQVQVVPLHQLVTLAHLEVQV